MSVAALCTSSGCDATCIDDASCARTGTCSVERKHFRRGGVCCLSCCATCFDCDGSFYWEGLARMPDDEPDSDGDLVDVNLCHCCHLRRTAPEPGRP